MKKNENLKAQILKHAIEGLANDDAEGSFFALIEIVKLTGGEDLAERAENDAYNLMLELYPEE